MTTNASDQNVRDNFDTGPLSWVMGEIREALTRSMTTIQDAVPLDSEAQSTALRHAKTYLHQAHGALQMVDVDGVAILTETVEEMLDRLESGKLKLTQELAQSISNTYQAVLEYLEELLAGEAHQPVRLFPYYKSLLEFRGAERIHPADLFFPNLAIRPQLPLAPPSDQALDYAALRRSFEKALLPFLKEAKDTPESANAAALGKVIAEIERAQSNQALRGFWWVMGGFAEVVASGKISRELYVKQLFARINLQIQRMSEGSSGIAERLLRDALFFIAQAKAPPLRAQQIRAAYQLEGQVPGDYTEKRYGKIDAESLLIAKEKLSAAKNIWNRFAGGEAGVSESFEQEMDGLTEAGSKLGSSSLSKLLHQVRGVAQHAARSGLGATLGLEIATSLLFIENALNHPSRLSEDFSERADAMTARLASIVAGKEPAQSAEWLDDISREAQQRQTITVLAVEMQSSLGQVEKMLDEFFSAPARRAALGPVDAILHQIEGALAILDENDAIRAVRHTRAAVKRFIDAEADAVPNSGEFQHVAQNIGALSFFIETLQLHSEGVKKRFLFDDASGVFHANLQKKNIVLDSTSGIGIDVDSDSPIENSELPPDASGDWEMPTVEADMLRHQQLSAALAKSLHATPDNPDLQKQLKESLARIRSDAALVEDADAGKRAQAAMNIMNGPDFVASEAAMTEISAAIAGATTRSEADAPPAAAAQITPVSAVAPASAAVVEPFTTVVVPDTDEAIDAELLEIFLSEADEVLACVTQTMPALRDAMNNQDHLTTLRRSFHTLKGSGRMVGLMAFGDAAWSIEQILNLRLSENLGGSTDIFALIDKAAEVLGAWVTELRSNGNSERTAASLVSAAERVKAGEPFSFEENVDVPAASGIEVEIEIETSLPDASPSAALAYEADGALALPQVEEGQMSDADMAAFHIEEATFAVEPAPPPVVAMPELAAPDPLPVSQVIHFPEIGVFEKKNDDNIKRIGSIEISLPLHNIYLAETDELSRLLSNDLAEWRHEPERGVNILAVHAAHSLAGSSATIGFEPLQEVAQAFEMVLQTLARQPVPVTAAEYDMLERGVACVKQMLQMFALGEMPAHEPQRVRELERLRQDFVIRAKKIESDTRASVLASNEADAEHLALLVERRADDSVPGSSAPDDKEEELSALAVQEQEQEQEVMISRDLTPQDDLDKDLLPVFLEEGSDILPQMGLLLRSWKQEPAATNFAPQLLRLLHTIKGSARMAGAMALGQHMHEMESRVEKITHAATHSPDAIEELLGRLDLGLHLFDQLQNPAAVNPAAGKSGVPHEAPQPRDAVKPLAAVTGNVLVTPAPLESMASVRGVAPSGANVPMVRVRADILDRLVNQAGEVSISRSRVETEIDTLRLSLSELTENVSRLRGQLREIEIQAESQMASQMAHSVDREFDPLEFDRFTRLQELTRMMAESVNDVASVQQNLSRTVDGATIDLSAQGRLTRDLQQDLMRVRMVQFASISERLYRVTRQASKEIGKRINLDIRGSAVEIDRSVLEKMAGPFEHLLRNSIVHGIESAEERLAAGKSETGELLVEIRQEGNEVVIQFSDDGQGLHLDRIRQKAKATGLLTDDSETSDAQLKDLIFHPGFSTAHEVTELAGRGVGMDVVRSEAAALGGRISIVSEEGKGAKFTIQLPLTLAVTQVVLLSTGGTTYAVPSVLVEQVQQLKANPLAAAYNEGAVTWQNNRVPMFYLSTLLGDLNATPLAQQYSPMVILKSGHDRVAIHVDEVIGNREVVVKNIGPQLARMVGVAGATVMGSGDIVLILDPVPLAQRTNQNTARLPRAQGMGAAGDMGAVAEMALPTAAVAKAQPVQGLRTQHIVMVVDDSLTVRRVTQRFLAREGYQVVLAKDGVDALEQLQSITPDVMLVDIEMPRMDGFDLTRNVRSDERTRHVPIIMITSRTATKHRNYAMELGVNEYLGKPYQEADLLRIVGEFANKKTPVE